MREKPEVKLPSNHAISADSEKRRTYDAPFFTAGYGKRYAPKDLVRRLVFRDHGVGRMIMNGLEVF